MMFIYSIQEFLVLSETLRNCLWSKQHDIWHKEIIKSGYLAPYLSPLHNKSNDWDKGMAFNYLINFHGNFKEGKVNKIIYSFRIPFFE